MKKVLTLTVAAALSLSLFAGCSSKPTTSDNNTSKNNNTTTEAGKLKDGKYSATYDHIDGKGWKPFLDIEVSGGKITKATFDYKNPDGKLKSQDADYEKSMKAKNGLGPAEYAPKLSKSIVDKQGVDIDVVTGATHSSEYAKDMAKTLVDKAAKGDTSAATLTMNDTYTAAVKDFDEHGYKAQVSVTYKDGKISAVVFDELDKDGKKKRDNADYNTQMKAKAGISAKEAADTLAKNYLEKGTVDTVAGATETSKTFKTLLDQAIAMRK